MHMKHAKTDYRALDFLCVSTCSCSCVCPARAHAAHALPDTHRCCVHQLVPLCQKLKLKHIRTHKLRQFSCSELPARSARSSSLLRAELLKEACLDRLVALAMSQSTCGISFVCSRLWSSTRVVCAYDMYSTHPLTHTHTHMVYMC